MVSRGVASSAVVLGIEVLGMVPDVLSHEGAHEVVGVVITLHLEEKCS